MNNVLITDGNGKPIKLCVEPIAPPIPTRIRFTAWVDGQEEWLQAYGATAADAIADLVEQIEEYFDEAAA